MIRDMQGLVQAVRGAKIERDISDLTLDDLAGFAPGTSAKYLGPNPAKGIGPLTLGLFLGALGKGLMLVDDPEQIQRVQKRWTKRVIRGGATVQMRRNAALSMSLSMQENARKQGVSEKMRELGKKGGKRRLQTMSRRARQRVATHAARMRWAKGAQK